MAHTSLSRVLQEGANRSYLALGDSWPRREAITQQGGRGSECGESRMWRGRAEVERELRSGAEGSKETRREKRGQEREKRADRGKRVGERTKITNLDEKRIKGRGGLNLRKSKPKCMILKG